MTEILQNKAHASKRNTHCQVSQILEHKASGLIRLDKQQYINGEPVEQKAYVSKVILIIGDWKELDSTESTLEKEIKKDI